MKLPFFCSTAKNMLKSAYFHGDALKSTNIDDARTSPSFELVKEKNFKGISNISVPGLPRPHKQAHGVLVHLTTKSPPPPERGVEENVPLLKLWSFDSPCKSTHTSPTLFYQLELLCMVHIFILVWGENMICCYLNRSNSTHNQQQRREWRQKLRPSVLYKVSSHSLPSLCEWKWIWVMFQSPTPIKWIFNAPFSSIHFLHGVATK